MRGMWALLAIRLMPLIQRTSRLMTQDVPQLVTAPKMPVAMLCSKQFSWFSSKSSFLIWQLLVATFLYLIQIILPASRHLLANWELNIAFRCWIKCFTFCSFLRPHAFSNWMKWKIHNNKIWLHFSFDWTFYIFWEVIPLSTWIHKHDSYISGGPYLYLIHKSRSMLTKLNITHLSSKLKSSQNQTSIYMDLIVFWGLSSNQQLHSCSSF